MKTSHLLAIFNWFVNQFQAIEAKFTAKAVAAEQQIVALTQAKVSHLEEAAKASRIGKALEALING